MGRMKASRKAFTLIELLVVVAIMGILVATLVGGLGGLLAGGTGYLEERTATIEVIRLYTVPSDTGTSYRVFAKVLQAPPDDESLEAETTFEISDSVLKGQVRSADLYGKLREKEIFTVVYYGIRSGYLSEFPKIISAESGRGNPGGGISDLYD